IGYEVFSAVCSDNAGNCRKGRRLFTNELPHILDIQDATHQLDKVCGDLGKLPVFDCVIKCVSNVIAHFSQSTHSCEHLDYAHQVLGIPHGLIKIGTTRFEIMYWAALALDGCAPAIAKIVDDPSLDIDIRGLNDLFSASSFVCFDFKKQVGQLLAILGLFAKAIKCLEAKNMTVADVYLYWLACVAQLADLIMKNQLGFDLETLNDIRAIVNRHFNELINNRPNDPYITGFFLDPRAYNHPLELSVYVSGSCYYPA
ncbi:hypothetical protein FISHEDRAFT_33185, partial [Fistulina hepatica ATCC 64428]